jgi:hypothetical protein
MGILGSIALVGRAHRRNAMAGITVEKCPETGICSIIKEGGSKVDLMPDEGRQLIMAVGDTSKAKEIIKQCDSSFAESLTVEELNDIMSKLG